MKLSQYTFCVEHTPNPNEYLLFNTRTQALVKVNQELKDLLDNYYVPQNFTLKEKYCTELIELNKMGIVVDGEQEDQKRLESFFHQLKHQVRKACFQVTILTTDACNFNCVYCFEKDSRTNTHMDASTSDAVLSWIYNQMDTFGYEELLVTFYGGEPLLNKTGLEYMAIAMKQWCEQRGRKFKFILQTNGYLLTTNIVDKYLQLGLCKVFISVDGLAHIHDCNRPLRGGGKTFRIIMRNIIGCVDMVNIGISTSYDKDDIAHIEELLDFFELKEILYKLSDFVFSPIHPSLGPRNSPKSFRQMSCMVNYEDEVILSANEKIRELMERKGLPARNVIAIAACPLTRKNADVTIDQAGRIYKCNSMLGYPEFAVGDVRAETYNDKHDEFLHLDAWRKCPQDCTYLPMCNGGCRFMAFLEHENFSAPTCKKRYLDKVVPEFLKKEYEAASGRTQ